MLQAQGQKFLSKSNAPVHSMLLGATGFFISFDNKCLGQFLKPHHEPAWESGLVRSMVTNSAAKQTSFGGAISYYKFGLPPHLIADYLSRLFQDRFRALPILLVPY